MKILSKIALTSAVLLSAHLAQAAVTSASIPVSLTVTPKCSISDVTSNIVIPTDTTNGTGSFKVTCNAPYSIHTHTSNTTDAQTFVKSTSNPNFTLRTNISVDRNGSAVPVNLGTPLSQPGLSVDTYNVNAALVAAVTNITPAGIYNDVLNISVDY